MTDNFQLLMLSAMYENGGNVTHRFLDGHPQMFVYPFESQLGTKLVNDYLSSMFPVKYRWPVFDLSATEQQDYRAIIDEEVKVRARTPNVSKFRHATFDFSDDERSRHYVKFVEESGRSRAHNVAAFFRGTFDAWKDYRRTGKEVVYVGYSPILIVDADKILSDLPKAHILHVVRNPWSAYADTKKRPVPLSLSHYLLAWTLNQQHALLFQQRFPENVHVVRFEDVIADPATTLGRICEQVGVAPASTLNLPTWNGTELPEVYPWGTIRSATPAANRDTALELSIEEREDVRGRAGHYLEIFDYKNFI
jgi:hypothetical protein